MTGAKVILTHRATERTSFAVSVTSEYDSSTVTPSVLSDPTQRSGFAFPGDGCNPQWILQNGGGG